VSWQGGEMENEREVVVPYIAGDGVGPEIVAATRAVTDAALGKATEGDVRIVWEELVAGERSHSVSGEWLPPRTLETIESRGVALKGPLTTPVAGGIRSLNVAIRQALDLYASVRPVRYFEGVPSPVRKPHKVDLVIFRENTEDVYKGLEWRKGSAEARALIDFLRSTLGAEISEDSGVGVKPISEFASKRLVRAAIKHALRKRLRTVTLVHKGNIMKFTEGAFRDWGYELAEQEFAGSVVTEPRLRELSLSSPPEGKVLINDRIADNMFQQVLTRPGEYSVLATPNLNGDYLADACAAQVGGLGIAPGANIGDRVAVFEAVHGTAPKYAGKNVANPCSMILSGAMMLEHLGFDKASVLIVRAVASALSEGVHTQDLARLSGVEKSVGTKEFAEQLIARL